MTTSRHYDTVAFDVRDGAAMLFFAETSKSGEIRRYLLVVSALDEDFNQTLSLEIDETQVVGDDVIEEAELDGNLLRLKLGGAAPQTFGAKELVLTFDESGRNRAGIESGALRVLGDKLLGGHG